MNHTTSGEPVVPDLANFGSAVEMGFEGDQGSDFKGNPEAQASRAPEGHINEIGGLAELSAIGYDYQIRNPGRRYGLG